MLPIGLEKLLTLTLNKLLHISPARQVKGWNAYYINIIRFVLYFLIFVSAGCKSKQLAKNDFTEETLIFQSGFESDCRLIPQNNDADIIGTDRSLPKPNDWVNDLDNNPDIGNFNLQYQGGDSAMRYAKIISEPGNPGNHVLHFWLNEPNVEHSKGRIQGNLYNNKGLKEFYQSVRMFLPNDFKAVRTFPQKNSLAHYRRILEQHYLEPICSLWI